MNNPGEILQTLDSQLKQSTQIILFGRAALALGFGKSGEKFGVFLRRTIDFDPSLERKPGRYSVD